MLGHAFFARLGELATIDPAGTPFARHAERPAPERCWQAALDHWQGVLDAEEDHPQPIAHAAIRMLRRNPPPPAQRVGIVHGDYRSGNFLHDGEGHLVAILDWEMAHLGDPLEDLAWALDPLWGHFDRSRVAGLISRAEALAIWEEHSGLHADTAALAWWSLFSGVKGQAIWATAAREYLVGGMTDPVLAIAGYYFTRQHDLLLSELMLAFEDRL